MSDFIYLATVYSSHSKWRIVRWWVRRKRFKAINKTAAMLMKAGNVVFSPISHSHPISQELPEHLNTYQFWLPQDFAILKHCTKMYILGTDNWIGSIGVLKEIGYCCRHNIPVYVIDGDGEIRYPIRAKHYLHFLKGDKYGYRECDETGSD